MQLFIGNKNYSSWSLRAWYLLSKFNISFTEQQLVLDTPDFYDRLKTKFPVQKVPALIDGDLAVWDSLAICEYINDAYLNGRAWPENLNKRAHARSVAAEMHSGFLALRNEMPMNIRAKRHVELTEHAKKDIARIDEIFSMRPQSSSNTWLYGEFSIVDAMFAPVVLRFKTYQVTLSSPAQAYCDQVLSCPVLKNWIAHALQETDIVTSDEAGENII